MNGDAWPRGILISLATSTNLQSGRHSSSRSHQSGRGDRDDRRGDRRGGDRDSRRRSRSPHRSSRREYEVDSYSSSRDYREREREDRYAGRDRREDRPERPERPERAWDRDRTSSRRDPRRDDDEPRARRPDPFDDRGDRGRGGRRDRGDRDGGFGGRDRKKSASPPPKKREPTPDLTNVTNVLLRKRRLTQWDIKPSGYDNVTAEQAKLSGMFPLPGAPRTQPMDPSRLQAFMNQPAGSATASALKPSNARQAKRLIVKNLPASATNQSLVDFLNLQLNNLNVVSGPDPCLSSHISNDRVFSLVEFKTAEDATFALAMDGITMEDNDMETSNGMHNGDQSGLKIRRPKDYIVPAVDNEEEPVPGVISNVVKDSGDKISISHIPTYLEDTQVSELLVAFGEVKSFILAKDIHTDQSRGIAFCEYVDPLVAEIALEGLNGMELGDDHLKVQRACVGVKQVAGMEMGVNAMSVLAATTSTDSEKGRVLQLLNMVTAEELMDDQDYQEIVEDVREECEKYGPIIGFKIPRPSGPRTNPGVGKIYVKYAENEYAQKALNALAGRKFADRTVVVTYFGEEYFDVDAW
ncbi:uncharacterized protein BDZ99DRAFT_490494 [Mytilinidion resinicola]|uniref:Splicing factor U2AF subunit n=1 Tax=Mytilinidion resinicola TaxID=574789 RepID=A0A6A6YDQ2_9PEZI|nr:uncharacterized protein BDZ99DRAFT_490494 [Mytilinidion resinicola]KAF2806124.1 hypothetical protein BDZ99DRAFT_490494 [Mytilinidion resinicola]